MKKMIFIALMVAAFTAVARADLLSDWKFDEGSGTIAHDSAGHNNGTLVHGPSWTTGRIGGALSFDGANDYVALSSFNVNTNHGTIALWFKTSGDFSGNYGYQGYLISDGSTVTKYLTLEGGGTHSYRIAGETNTQDDYFVGTPATFAGPWNHIAVSFDNKTATTYLNGEFLQTMSVTNSSLTLDRIGGLPSEFYNGLMDDVRIYDNALSQSDIRAIMPEPATLFLLGLGAVMLRRRRK